jgi:hypothetical protein
MTVRHRRPRDLVSVCFVVVLLAACSGGDEPESGADTTARSTTTTTQPSATDDEAAAFAAVEEVVLEALSLADKMYQDPAGTVEDPEQEDLERYHSLFAEGAETPDLVEEGIRTLAADGLRLRASPATGVFRETRVYSPQVVDADTVRFRVCALRDIETVDSAGNVVNQRAEVEQGVGEARREGGVWRFFGVSPADTGPLPLTPGAVNSGLCDTVAAEVEGPA